jgi:uncharacterized protein YggE
LPRAPALPTAIAFAVAIVLSATTLGVSSLLAARALATPIQDLTNRGRTFEASGTASEDLTADVATVKLTLTAEATRREDAVRRDERDRARVVAWLEGAGVPSAAVDTGAPEAEPVFAENASGLATEKVKGQRVTRTFTLASIPPVLADRVVARLSELEQQDVAVAADAPEYRFPARAAAEQRVITAAIRDARERARASLREAGGSLGRLRALEVGDVRMVPRGADADGQGGTCGPVQTLRATVRATYEVGP